MTLRTSIISKTRIISNSRITNRYFTSSSIQLNHYETLSLRPDASKAEIKTQFYRLSKQYHPDFNPENKEGAAKKFHGISEAYETLSDDRKRREYDREVLEKKSIDSLRPTARRKYGYRTSYSWRPPRATGSHNHDTYAPRDQMNDSLNTNTMGKSTSSLNGQNGQNGKTGLGQSYAQHYERQQIAQEKMEKRRRMRDRIFTKNEGADEKFSLRLGQFGLSLMAIWGIVASGIAIFR